MLAPYRSKMVRRARSNYRDRRTSDTFPDTVSTYKGWGDDFLRNFLSGVAPAVLPKNAALKIEVIPTVLGIPGSRRIKYRYGPYKLKAANVYCLSNQYSCTLADAMIRIRRRLVIAYLWTKAELDTYGWSATTFLETSQPST